MKRAFCEIVTAVGLLHVATVVIYLKLYHQDVKSTRILTKEEELEGRIKGISSSINDISTMSRNQPSTPTTQVFSFWF